MNPAILLPLLAILIFSSGGMFEGLPDAAILIMVGGLVVIQLIAAVFVYKAMGDVGKI